MHKFWDALGSKGEIKPAEADTGADIEKFEKKLFRYSFFSAFMKFLYKLIVIITIIIYIE